MPNIFPPIHIHFFPSLFHLPPSTSKSFQAFYSCFFSTGRRSILSWKRLQQGPREVGPGRWSGGICRCGGRQARNFFFFFFAKIKGSRDWTSQGQFHMPLRGPIVPTWNRTPLYAAALKNNVGPPHNRICGIPTGQQAPATWNSLHWPWSGRAVWPPQQWQH